VLPEVLDINDPSSKSQVDNYLKEIILYDEATQSQYHSKWNQIDRRLIGDDVPAGFSNLYSADYASAAADTALKRKRPMFVPVPLAHSTREGILGDFITGKKSLTTSGRTFADRKMANVLKQYMQYLLDKSQFDDAILMPAMDHCIGKGLDWLGAEYDPMACFMGGCTEAMPTIKCYRVNCRDVLVDSNAQGSFFLTDRRRTHRIKLPTQETNKKFARVYPLFREVPYDRDYEIPYILEDATRSISSTFYRIEIKREEQAVLYANPETGEMDLVPLSESQGLNQQLISNPVERDFIYRFLYNKHCGAFHQERLPYSRFTLVPLVDIESDSRRYPVGDMEIFDSLFDLINVIATALIENAKRSNKGVGQMTPETWKDPLMVKAVTEAIEHGGAAPGLVNLYFPNTAAPIFARLIEIVQDWLATASARHSATQGELPAKQIAQDTVRMLIAQDRTSHGRKDVTLRYALTEFARLLAEMVVLHVSEEELIEITDAPPGSPKYVPINKTFTQAEYEDFLAQAYSLKVPQISEDTNPNITLQEVQSFDQAMMKSEQNFEANNNVRKRKVPGFIVHGQQVTQDELSKQLGESGLGTEEYQKLYKPQEAPEGVTVYDVNHIANRKVDLNIRFEIDQDYESDQQFRSQRAIELRKMGEMSGLDMLKEMNMADAETIHEHAQADNQALELAKQFASDPQLMAAAMQLIQGTQSGQAPKPPSISASLGDIEKLDPKDQSKFSEKFFGLPITPIKQSTPQPTTS
jgi:hypothetical protein